MAVRRSVAGNTGSAGGQAAKAMVAFLVTDRAAVHFVGFRGEEYWSAVRIWGRPGFIHMGWDRRAQREIVTGDVVVFARGDADQPIGPYNFPDTKEMLS